MTDFDPSDPRFITLGEVFRSLGQLRSEISSLRSDVSNLKFVSVERYLADQATNLLRIQQIESHQIKQDEKQTWTFRMTITAIFGSVVAAIIPIVLIKAFG